LNPKRASHGGIQTSTKVKLPSQFHTIKHKCSQCPRDDAKKYPISGKEVRWLCSICLNKNRRRDDKEKPNFIRAGVLRRK